MRLLPLLAAAYLAALPAAALAQNQPAPVGPTAGNWQRNCAVFVDTLSGKSNGSDAEISYCVGQTEGIVGALKTGSQIGALAFGGLLVVEAGMNEQAVFDLFERADPDRLLGVCMPAGTQTAAQIETVYKFLDRQPAKRELPVTAVFFEALQERYPCPKAPTARPQ
ncbi:MAG TPA: Rap1a/Tai family immunity protein [Azospirillaceae bacterium]|nr:Rap1a/Tai family immunity protein [Azospirillaceae bacterium]